MTAGQSKNIRTNKSFLFKVLALKLSLVILFFGPSFFRILNSNAKGLDPIVYAQPSSSTLSDSSRSRASNQTTATKPAEVIIGQSVVKVAEAHYDPEQARLMVPKTTAAWFTESPKINQGGATFIYGHNTKEVFLPVLSLEDGDQITIKGEDGLVYIFYKTKTVVLDPKNTEILDNLYTEENDLIILTCTTDFRNSRRVATYFKAKV